jgi:S1-C subfamily serine protease
MKAKFANFAWVSIMICVVLVVGDSLILSNVESNTLLERSSSGYSTYSDYDQGMLNLPVAIPSVAATAGRADLNLTALFDEVDQSVVQVSRSFQNTPGSTQGSGFVYDDLGHIVTNYHVVAGLQAAAADINPEEEFQITFLDGTNYVGRVVGADRYSELAVLEVENITRDKLVPLSLGDSSQLEIGEQVIAIGNPFGLSGSMTEGIVSGLGRTLPSSSSQGDQLLLPQQPGPSFLIPNVIQTDAAINPGNSGGPLLKTDGEVIGMNTAIFSNTGVYAGVGFAIPSNIVKKIVPELISTGTYRHPYIGIAGVDVSPEIASIIKLNDSRGFLVTEVTAGSPADRSGIKGGDVLTDVNGRQIELGGDVIVAVDNTTVREIDDLLSYLETEKSIGENVILRIIRDGEVQEIGVTLAPRPTEQEQGQQQIGDQSQQQARPTLGINAINMSDNIAEMMNLTLLQDNFAGKGALVVDVLSGGPAEEAGIRGGYIVTDVNGTEIELGGDVIVAIDNTRIPNIDALRTFIEDKNIGESVQVTVIRDNQEVTLPVTLGSTSELDIDQQQPNNGSSFSIEPPLGSPFSFFDDLYNQCMETFGQAVCNPLFGR